MKSTLPLILVWGLLLSCSSLPEMIPDEQSSPTIPDNGCRGLFPEGSWQLTHTIEASLPGRQKGFMLGLTVLSPATRSVKVVIMTLEGFVVFKARSNGQTSVERAVAPFDNDTFARGLMADIDLIYFKPSSQQRIAGRYRDGAYGCRYLLADGRVVDLVDRSGDHWETRLYQTDRRLVRTVDSDYGRERNGVARKIKLTAHGNPAYALTLTLVEALPLGAE